MVLFVDQTLHEVFRFSKFLLESTVEIRVRLEAESSISDAINFNVAAF